MIMRYHWGLGVGHVYTHARSSGTSDRSQAHYFESQDIEATEDETGNIHPTENDPDNPEFGLENREDDGWDTDEAEDGDSNSLHPDFSDDDILIAMNDMYGLQDFE